MTRAELLAALERAKPKMAELPGLRRLVIDLEIEIEERRLENEQ